MMNVNKLGINQVEVPVTAFVELLVCVMPTKDSRMGAHGGEEEERLYQTM